MSQSSFEDRKIVDRGTYKLSAWKEGAQLDYKIRYSFSKDKWDNEKATQ